MNRYIFATLVIAMLTLYSCGTQRSAQKSSVEFEGKIFDPCTGEETNSISIQDSDAIDIRHISADECEFSFKTTCGKKVNISSTLNPKIVIPADADEPSRIKYLMCDTVLICDTCFCHTKDEWVFAYTIGLGYRSVAPEETFNYYNKEGELVSQNVPKSYLPLFEGNILKSIDNYDKLKIGSIIGLWYAEDNIYIPMGVGWRYIFSPRPYPTDFPCNCKQGGSNFKRFIHCGTPYVLADLGLPFDFVTGAPIFNGTEFPKYQRYFFDVGLGYSVSVNKNFDLSFDLGLRDMNLPLKEIECCPQIPRAYRHPFRNTIYPFFRFGIIF